VRSRVNIPEEETPAPLVPPATPPARSEPDRSL
jgi:hypothetical protein